MRRGAAAVAAVLAIWLLASAAAVGLPSLDPGSIAALPSRLVDILVAVSVVSVLWWWIGRHEIVAGPLRLAVVLLIGLALAAGGIRPLAALLLILGPALVIGRLFHAAVASPAVRLVLGLGIVAGFVGWLLPLPIFHPAAAALLSAVIMGWGRVKLVEEWSAWVSDSSPDPSTGRSGIAGWAWVLAVVVGSLPAWLPLRNADDLSLRVGLGYELLDYAYARFDVGTQVWALSPWSSDLLHALMTLLAEGEASGPLSALWVLLAAWLVRGIALRLGAGESAALLAGALYASLPITAFLAGGLQTEAMTGVALAALATVLLQHDQRPPSRALLAVALLAGILMGIKVSNALFLLPMGLWMLIRWWRFMPWSMLPFACVSGVLVGGSSYTYAWLLTGNPMLPVFNEVFRSPWFPPENFVDVTWQTGFPWAMPWQMLVDSTRYFEGLPGAAGFSPLLVLALLPAALARPNIRALACVGLVGYLLVLWQVQYLRYFHPSLVLILPAVMAALPVARGVHVGGAVVVLLQLVLLPTSSWMFMQGIFRERVLQGESAVVQRYVPEKMLFQDFRALAGPADRVLMTDPLRGFVALLPGRAVGANWHNPRIERIRVANMDAPETWGRIVRETGASHVIVPLEGIPAGVAGMLASQQALTVSRRGLMQLMVLRGLPAHPVDAVRAEDGTRIGLYARIPTTHAWAGTFAIEVKCSTPGKPVLAAWTLQAAGRAVTQRWEWLPCPADGHLRLARDVLMPADSVDNLHLGLSPAVPDSDMTLALLAQHLELRRDLLEETDLAEVFLPEGCRGVACAQRGALIVDRAVSNALAGGSEKSGRESED